MRGLYAIVDTTALAARGLDPVAFASAVLEARPAAMQLRDKGDKARRTLSLLEPLVELSRQAGVPFFVNDRPDLALLSGAPGVHVGQDDLPVSAVRAFCARADTRLLVGLSTHNLSDVERGVLERPDYLAIGPIFGTQSKADAAPTLGLSQLAALSGRARALGYRNPLVAIGGITMQNAAAVARHVELVAVIGALLPEASAQGNLSEVRARARDLQDAIVGTAFTAGEEQP